MKKNKIILSIAVLTLMSSSSHAQSGPSYTSIKKAQCAGLAKKLESARAALASYQAYVESGEAKGIPIEATRELVELEKQYKNAKCDTLK
jgi:hypothetical protein